MDYWENDDPIPRDELLKRVKGVDAIFCLLTEKIDAELLDAAGLRRDLFNLVGQVDQTVAVTLHISKLQIQLRLREMQVQNLKLVVCASLTLNCIQFLILTISIYVSGHYDII